MTDHTPVTRDWVLGYVANEVSRLDGPTLRRWEGYVVEPWVGHLTRRPGATSKEVFVVAERGREVLYWDDLKNEFGRGKRVAAKWIEPFGVVGARLTWALQAFHPKGKPGERTG
ncbi:MAG: hypothetical protein QNJ98_17720 [Planctomycetota bacterium]|nr:hypothetical protein [Planctomycetota bacterium]